VSNKRSAPGTRAVLEAEIKTFSCRTQSRCSAKLRIMAAVKGVSRVSFMETLVEAAWEESKLPDSLLQMDAP
jgi:hypothetical protein